jgi:hypothetical protein
MLQPFGRLYNYFRRHIVISILEPRVSLRKRHVDGIFCAHTQAGA